jgi:DNA mismatch repair protein MutL
MSGEAIREMEPGLVAQIKAGEVIERPASVAKELLENAIDAGARRIRVEIAEGGTRLIRVVDDGDGIAADQIALAFEEHTSSKLHTAAGLDRIRTLGFRGEALHAIASIARVDAISGARGSSVAAAISYDHGHLLKSEPAAPAGGTRMSVMDIFSGVPARRKHLRSGRSEAMAVQQVVAQYAVGHSDVAITLVSDGRTVLASPGTGEMRDAVGAVYGADLAARLLDVYVPGEPFVHGLISPPDLTRSNRTAVLVFVNGRPIRSAALSFAIEDAYSGQLMVGRHPVAALCITVDPADLDPNVHPTKLEVRFWNGRKVFAAVRSAVLQALNDKGEVPVPGVDFNGFWGETVDTSFALTSPQDERRPIPEQVSFEVLPPERARPSLGEVLPVLRVFGQSAQTFIVAEGPAGLYMIDQHAAHERVLFDELAGSGDDRLAQPLLDPLHLDLTSEQWDAFEAHQGDLKGLGFEVEPFGDRACMVRTVPVVGKRPVPPEVLADVLDAINAGGSATDMMYRMLEIVACKAAVKAGQPLSLTEMRELVSRLERTEHPRTCPHGRPTTVHISTERLEREFGRR